MGWQSWTLWFVWCAISSLVLQNGECSPAPAYNKPKLIYIMMDGFRWDYIDHQSESDLPGFTKFLNNGVRAQWTNPLFPSLSYPTWTTLVTGQYAESHNLVGNYMYDDQTKEVFALFDNNATGKQKWWTSEPIWTTAEKGGLKTAQYMWARCDVPIDGITTHYCEPFSTDFDKYNFNQNIMEALKKLDEGYDFIQVYTGYPDDIGHKYGPNSEEIRQAVREMDDIIGTLMTELEDRELTNHVNIVIVSDHGMANTDRAVTQFHEIDDYLDTSLVENIADKGLLLNIKVPQENIQKVFDQLSHIPGMTVYKKEDIPEHVHYKNGKYVHEIVVLANEGNFLMGSFSNKQLPLRTHNRTNMGSHGYSPDLQAMKGIFLAKGPAFREGVVIDPIHVVDVYQVLTNVLQLTPHSHNGTWDHVEHAFRTPKQDNGVSTFLVAFTLLFFFITLFKFL